MSFGKEARSPSTRDRGIGRNCRERSAAGVKTSCILWYELTFPTPRTNGRGEDDLASVMITLEKLTMLVRFLSDLIEKGLLRCENAATTCRECTSRISPRKTFGGAQYSCLGPQPVPLPSSRYSPFWIQYSPLSSLFSLFSHRLISLPGSRGLSNSHHSTFSSLPSFHLVSHFSHHGRLPALWDHPWATRRST